MNDLHPIDLQDPEIKSRPSASGSSRKIAILLLASLIASAMIIWFAFLGWGIVGILHWFLAYIYSLWTTYL
jgi:4-hydroxybenzoate polyprenyltransferase